MQQLQNYALILILTTFLAACVTPGLTPKTPRQYLAYLENQYYHNIAQLAERAEAGALTADQDKAIDEYERKTFNAIVAARKALEIGDSDLFKDETSTIDSMILLLINLLKEVEK